MAGERLVWVSPQPSPGWGTGGMQNEKISSAAVARWRLEVCELGDRQDRGGAPPEAPAAAPPPGLTEGPPRLAPPPPRDPPLALQQARWTALRELGWRLRSDQEVRPEVARAFFAQAGPGLVEWMEAQAKALATAHPFLAEKSTTLRLHFVALGEEWFQALLENPTLAVFLEEENQAVDLEEVLAATHPLFAVAGP